MKRYFLLFTALFLLLTTTACGAGDLGSPEYMAEKQRESEAATSTPEEAEPVWSDNFDGLLDCFEWNGYVLKDTKTQTLANVIGAAEGYRYKSQVGKSQFYVELYYFDPANLNETSNNIISEIKETGSFHMLDSEIPAVLSDNKKYMMVYNDPSSDELNINKKQEAIDTLVNFN